MGKNKKNKTNDSGIQADKPEKRPSGKKLQQDGKAKKAKEIDHLKHIPFRLREIMKSKERMKSGAVKAKKVKAMFPECKPEDSQDGDIPVPHFRRGRCESEKAYLRRMEIETKHVLFLTKNQVDRRPELDADKQERHADKGKSEKKKEYDKVRLEKQRQKKLDRKEANMEKEMFVDHVPFGEVTMAPPSLSVKPRKALVKSQASKGLLLNSLLGQTTASTTKPSMARQRIMEEERERAVKAYRCLKKQKQQQHKIRTVSLEKVKNIQ